MHSPSFIQTPQTGASGKKVAAVKRPESRSLSSTKMVFMMNKKCLFVRSYSFVLASLLFSFFFKYEFSRNERSCQANCLVLPLHELKICF